MTRGILTRAGVGEVTIAGNGQAALALIDSKMASIEAFDLILIDLEMPVMVGDEAIHDVRTALFI